jgi:hypothetical protein
MTSAREKVTALANQADSAQRVRRLAFLTEQLPIDAGEEVTDTAELIERVFPDGRSRLPDLIGMALLLRFATSAQGLPPHEIPTIVRPASSPARARHGTPARHRPHRHVPPISLHR